MNVGTQCIELVDQFKAISENKAVDKAKINKSIIKWFISIKSAMKIVDYSVDESTFEKDIYQFLLNNPDVINK